MTSSPIRQVVFLSFLLFAAACSTGKDPTVGDGGSDGCVGSECGSGEDGGGAGKPDGTVCPLSGCPDGGDDEPCGGECAQGEACVDDACCAEENLCGNECCGGTEMCFGNACVTPGVPCVSDEICGAGSYCELGIPGGTNNNGCGGSVQNLGRCLVLPPDCGGAVTSGCVNQACQIQPKAASGFDVEQEWWWGPSNLGTPTQPAKTETAKIDVWSTPAVGRIVDANCDGKVDQSDPPNVVFVSADVTGGTGNDGKYCGHPTIDTCDKGVLRVLNGATGEEAWTLAKIPGSTGFRGVSVALADMNGDDRLDIVAMTAEMKIAVLDHEGQLLFESDTAYSQIETVDALRNMGWGGALSVADIEGDGFPEVAFNTTVWTTKSGQLKHLWTPAGTAISGAWERSSTSFFADVVGDSKLELVTGTALYDATGTPLWRRTDLETVNPTPPNLLISGFAAVADFLMGVSGPEIVLVASGSIYLLNPIDGTTVLGPKVIGTGDGLGGPPTVGDFDGAPNDTSPEIGVATKSQYVVVDPTEVGFADVWAKPVQDVSSSQTGSSVFDFEGDGQVEVVYNDECYVWVFDGKTGAEKAAIPTKSFTASESSIVADVDGDDKAEILVIANGVDDLDWDCSSYAGSPTDNRPAWTYADGVDQQYRGIRAYRDVADGWVGTRSLWNQHAYSVTNICDSSDDACLVDNGYGTVPKTPRKNWN
ncbi:MAG: VCBS repeat-containing protein, partial [Myxococcales bacterium]|nr:VCBS repeat-containing protein [Myxococcales bacterium]